MLMWTEPQPLNGILSHYTIQYSLNGIDLTNTTSNTEFSILNLNTSTTVSNIFISATTGGGKGPLSDVFNTSTLQKPGNTL